jgi:hypothetical protein
MTDLYEKIAAERGWFQRLMVKVPGFRGYKEKSDRREADKMLRNHLADKVDAIWTRMGQVEKQIIKGSGLTHTSATREAKDKVRIYRDRLKSAAPGYSAMWDALKIDEQDLEKLYRFDELQVRYIELLGEKVDALEAAVKSGEGIEDAISAVYDTALEADNAFKKREDVLTELDKSLG